MRISPENGETYDVIFDSVGKTSFRRCRASLVPGGLYIESDLGFLWLNPLLAVLTRVGGKRVTLPLPRYTKQNVQFVKELLEAGRYRAVIDRCYPLEDVADADDVRGDGAEDGQRGADRPGRRSNRLTAPRVPPPSTALG